MWFIKYWLKFKIQHDKWQHIYTTEFGGLYKSDFVTVSTVSKTIS